MPGELFYRNFIWHYIYYAKYSLGSILPFSLDGKRALSLDKYASIS